jgi:hypothetical protein
VGKTYDDSEMRDVRAAFEDIVLRFPLVSTKFMFGSPCYLAADSLFAFLVKGGVVLTCLDEALRKELVERFDGRAFVSGGKTMSKWIQVGVAGESDFDAIVEYIQASYEAALIK